MCNFNRKILVFYKFGEIFQLTTTDLIMLKLQRLIHFVLN